MKKYIEKLSKNLDYLSHEENDNSIIITVSSNQNKARCPYCKEYSNSVNTRYYRKIQDLPYKGKTVYIRIKHKIYDCLNENCNQTRFGEVYDFAKAGAERTDRLDEYIIKESEGLAVRKAEKKLKDQGIIVSKNTINRFHK